MLMFLLSSGLTLKLQKLSPSGNLLPWSDFYLYSSFMFKSDLQNPCISITGWSNLAWYSNFYILISFLWKSWKQFLILTGTWHLILDTWSLQVLDRLCLLAFTSFTVILSAAALIAAPHVIVEWNSQSVICILIQRQVKDQFKCPSCYCRVKGTRSKTLPSTYVCNSFSCCPPCRMKARSRKRSQRQFERMRGISDQIWSCVQLMSLWI